MKFSSVLYRRDTHVLFFSSFLWISKLYIYTKLDIHTTFSETLSTIYCADIYITKCTHSREYNGQLIIAFAPKTTGTKKPKTSCPSRAAAAADFPPKKKFKRERERAIRFNSKLCATRTISCFPRRLCRNSHTAAAVLEK